MSAEEIPESVLARIATDFSAREQPSKKRMPTLLLIALVLIVAAGGWWLWQWWRWWPPPDKINGGCGPGCPHCARLHEEMRVDSNRQNAQRETRSAPDRSLHSTGP